MDVTYEKPTPTPVYYGPANPIQLVPNPTPLCQETAPNPTPIEEKKDNKNGLNGRNDMGMIH